MTKFIIYFRIYTIKTTAPLYLMPSLHNVLTEVTFTIVVIKCVSLIWYVIRTYNSVSVPIKCPVSYRLLAMTSVAISFHWTTSHMTFLWMSGVSFLNYRHYHYVLNNYKWTLYMYTWMYIDLIQFVLEMFCLVYTTYLQDQNKIWMINFH